MDSLAAARELTSIGRFREALEELQRRDVSRGTSAAQLLRAELLTIVGEAEQAIEILRQIEKTRGLSETDKSCAEFVWSRIAKEHGQLDEEFLHLRKSLKLAEHAQNLERTCVAQLYLIALVADQSGPDSVIDL